MRLILSSMKPQIGEKFLFLETTHQIWDALAKSYSKIGHTAKVYKLRQLSEQSLALYDSSLRKLWDELEHYNFYCPSCVRDTATYKHVEDSGIGTRRIRWRCFHNL